MAKKIVTSSQDIMGGTPVFAGTRVPVETLFDYLEGDGRIEEFLEDFPSVSKSQVVGLLEQLKLQMLHPRKAA